MVLGGGRQRPFKSVRGYSHSQGQSPAPISGNRLDSLSEVTDGFSLLIDVESLQTDLEKVARYATELAVLIRSQVPKADLEDGTI